MAEDDASMALGASIAKHVVDVGICKAEVAKAEAERLAYSTKMGGAKGLQSAVRDKFGELIAEHAVREAYPIERVSAPLASPDTASCRRLFEPRFFCRTSPSGSHGWCTTRRSPSLSRC